MKVKVSSLKHHPKNKEIYTLSSIEELMESISEVGLLQPLIIDSRNQIISGNRRFESVKRLGWEEVQVEVKDVQEGVDDLTFFDYNLIFNENWNKFKFSNLGSKSEFLDSLNVVSQYRNDLFHFRNKLDFKEKPFKVLKKYLTY